MATRYWVSTTPGSFTTAGNWYPSGAPANGDTLVFNALGPGSVNSGLNTSLTGVTLVVDKGYTGSIGVMPSGNTPASYLTLVGGALIVGRESGGTSSGTGSPAILVDFGGTAATVTVYDSGSTSTVPGLPPILLKGSNLTIHHLGGKIGVAAVPGETATVTYNCGSQAGVISPTAFFGTGATITLLSMQSGTVLSVSGNTVASATVSGGTYIHQGSGAHTDLTTVAGGTVLYDGTGTITTLNNAGVFRRSRGTDSLAITTLNLYSGATLDLDNGRAGTVTISNVNLNCKLHEASVRLPYGVRL